MKNPKQLIKYHIGCVRIVSEQEIKTKYRKYSGIAVCHLFIFKMTRQQRAHYEILD